MAYAKILDIDPWAAVSDNWLVAYILKLNVSKSKEKELRNGREHYNNIRNTIA